MQWTSSSPPASEIPARPLRRDSITATDINGPNQPHELAQEGIVNGDGLDSAINAASDPVWTLADVWGCNDMDFSVFSPFPDMVVDEPSSGTSDATAPTPSTLLSVDALLSQGSAKSAVESIQTSLDVADDDPASGQISCGSFQRCALPK
jgi:hypothetical protein